MVDADDVIEPPGAVHTADPPAEPGLGHFFIIVERIAPKLTVRTEVVGRDAGDLRGDIVFIQLEILRLAPHVRGVHGHIDGQIADDADAKRVDIGLERSPLPEKEKLNIGEQLNVRLEEPAVFFEGSRASAAANVLVGPLAPGLHAEVPLERHEQSVVRKPVRILRGKALHLTAVALETAFGGFLQKRKAVFVELPVIDTAGIRAPVTAFDLPAREKPVVDQRVEIDEIRVACKGGKALVGGVAAACGTKREQLPVALTGRVQKIGKIIRGPAHRADAVG